MKKLLFSISYQVPTHSIKKNQRPIYRDFKTGKPFLGKTQEKKDIENLHVSYLMQMACQQNLETITDDLEAEFLFVYPKQELFTLGKKPRRKLNLGDLSNLIQMPEDALQKAKIIKNDAQILSYGSSGVRFWNNPTFLIKINLFTFNQSLEYHEDE